MSSIVTLGRSTPVRQAPVEYRDAAALYARGFGAGGDVVWLGDPVNCWQVRITLSPGDPRLRKQDGEEIYETVELQEFVHPDPTHVSYPRHNPKLLDSLRRHHATNRLLPGFVAFELDDIGVSGLVEMLERGSLLSGRGEQQSLEGALHHIRGREHIRRDQAKAESRQYARDLSVATRRRILKIPFIPVGIELRRNTTSEV